MKICRAIQFVQQFLYAYRQKAAICKPMIYEKKWRHILSNIQKGKW